MRPIISNISNAAKKKSSGIGVEKAKIKLPYPVTFYGFHG